MDKKVKAIYKHPRAIRWMHWINFPLLLVMVWSGLLIYWANDVYKVGFGDTTLVKFFPQKFYDTLNVPFRLAEGMGLHFFFMWFFTLNGIIYFLYLIISKEYKFIFPNKKSVKESIQVVLHDLRLRKQKPPQTKYNAAQRIAYTTILILGFLVVLTGMAIYKPVQLNWLCTILGGYEAARIEHFVITIIFVLFFLVHIIQVIKAGFNNFRAMVTGYEIDKTK
jgi:thiosulfate reductase cytochrome b subunit